MAKGGFIVASAKKKKKSYVMDFGFSKVWLIKINKINFHLCEGKKSKFKCRINIWIHIVRGLRGVKTHGSRGVKCNGVSWCCQSPIFIKNNI